MALDLFDNVFLLHLSLEAPKSAIQRLAIIDDDLSHALHLLIWTVSGRHEPHEQLPQPTVNLLF
jgi:hypothetical protein